MADDDSTQYAEGVKQERSFWGTEYTGSAESLVACGLVKQEWLPGVPGYGKCSRYIIFDENGVAIPLPNSKGKRPKHDFGALHICRIGRKFKVQKLKTLAERQQMEAEQESKKRQEIWTQAKQARGEQNYTYRWRSVILDRIAEIEGLITGHLVFVEFPEIVLSQQDREKTTRAVEDLRNALLWARPYINDLATKDNVISFRDAAYRRFAG